MTDIEALNKLAEILGTTSETIIDAYTSWFVYSSIAWLLVGVTLVVAGLRWTVPEDWEAPSVVLKALVVFVGLLFICSNVPDLIEPKAAAIHQLIYDVRR